MHTAVEDSRDGGLVRELMASHGVGLRAHRLDSGRGMRYRGHVERGEPHTLRGGRYPALQRGWLSVSPEEWENCRGVILDTNVSGDAMRLISARCRDLDIPSVCIVSAPSRAHGVLAHGGIGWSAVAMNRHEFRRLGSPRNIVAGVGAPRLLVTSGADGLEYRDHSMEPPMVRMIAAPPVPEGAHYNGCGDSAAAGILAAILNGEEPLSRAAGMVAKRMARNAGQSP